MATYSHRETREPEQKANGREKVAAAARRGDHLEEFADEDLAWAFAGHEDELTAHRAKAEQVRAARLAKAQAIPLQRELDHTTKAVLAEWDAAEQADRLAKAQKEARRRLGWGKS